MCVRGITGHQREKHQKQGAYVLPQILFEAGWLMGLNYVGHPHTQYISAAD